MSTPSNHAILARPHTDKQNESGQQEWPWTRWTATDKSFLAGHFFRRPPFLWGTLIMSGASVYIEEAFNMTHMIWLIWYDSYKWFLECRNVLDHYRNDQPKNYVLSGHLIGVLILYFKMLFLMFRKRSLIHDDKIRQLLNFKGGSYSP